MDSKLRLYRDGIYPPYRGALAKTMMQGKYYIAGARFATTRPIRAYMFQPLELRIVKSEESPSFIAEEILGLTKMNWNNTQFDGKYRVTLGCARKAGEIMKYMNESELPQVRYGYYM